MLGECRAVTTKMLSHGLRSRWSSRCEACEASGQQPPVAETVARGGKNKPLMLFLCVREVRSLSELSGQMKGKGQV